jgi:hypothetical protein
VASSALSVWAFGLKACSQGPSTTTAEIHLRITKCSLDCRIVMLLSQLNILTSTWRTSGWSSALRGLKTDNYQSFYGIDWTVTVRTDRPWISEVYVWNEIARKQLCNSSSVLLVRLTDICVGLVSARGIPQRAMRSTPVAVTITQTSDIVKQVCQE